MVFSSLVFLYVFLPVVLFAFTVLPRALRNPFLLLTNLVFYGWGEPVYLLLMLAVTIANYVLGYIIGRTRATAPKTAKAALIAAIVLSLSALGYFKYAAFFAELVNSVPFLPTLPVPNISLPIGISFYTFQAMSYSIDVWRNDVPYQKNPIDFSVYITLFPQLIAGPIVRYKDVAAQLNGERADVEQFSLGIKLFIIGMCKKVIIANRMGLLWDTLRAGSATGGRIASLVGLMAYTLQIYFDFSGYSDMACGLGHMLGFRFMRNFDYPYMSRSITEFWRRWHISLSTWFRDYVYIPLGGNRVKPLRHYMNLFAVWFLTGMWHGASWNFILWGLYYFVILVLEKAFLLKTLEKLPNFVRHLYSLIIIMFGWAIFYFDTGLTACFGYLSTLFTAGAGWLSHDSLVVIVRYLPILLVACVASTPLCASLRARYKDKAVTGYIDILLCMAGLLLCTAILVNESYNPFLYFKF